MGRRQRSAGHLAGWLFADLALVLSFAFLDSSADGGAGSNTSIAAVSTSTVVTTTTSPNPSGADPTPIEVEVATEYMREPETFLSELEEKLSQTDHPRKGAPKFLVVLVRVGSKDQANRDFAKPLARRVESILKDGWKKVEAFETYYDTGDDTTVAFGQVKLKLFPASN